MLLKVSLFMRRSEKKTENKWLRYVLIALVFIVVSFILAYAGHFLYDDIDDEKVPLENPSAPLALDEATQQQGLEPVKYIHLSETINQLKQEINILEIDASVSGVRIQPALSHDLIYGFEKLSVIAARKGAYAAVNGGFFYDYGLPSGMVVIDGRLISTSSGNYPVFVVEGGKAELKEIKSEVTIKYKRGTETGSIDADSFNFPKEAASVSVYTPDYGKYNRAEKKNITATVEDGVVTKVAFYSGEAEIPKNGMLVTFFNVEKYKGIEAPLEKGDMVNISHKPDIGENADAYECGSWLVRDGKSVVPPSDPWVGVLTNRDPRTAVGIKKDGTVLLVTVDGRQPGYSAGFTGDELASYMLGLGAENAAMLDGGASTEMLFKGELVSRPSHKGEERPVAGGLMVLWKEK